MWERDAIDDVAAARYGGRGSHARSRGSDCLVCPANGIVGASPERSIGEIGAGIFIFLAVSRWGQRILILLIGSEAQVDTAGQAVYLFSYTAFLYVAAALAGGAVAGAWSVNWVPQGIGVGLGVLAIPLLLLIFLLPASLPVYLIGVLITTGLTVLGAYLGHRLVQPAQFIS